MRQLVVNRIELIGQSEATNPQGLSHTLPLADYFSRTIPMSKRIKLTQGKYAIVDDVDYARISQYKWCAAWQGNWYVVGNHNVRMHRLIMGLEKGDRRKIDHHDGNGLNNQRDNLRICTHAENIHNQRLQVRTKTSKYKGVTKPKKSKKWIAQIKVEGRCIYLGGSESETVAAKLYDKAAKAYFGEFARLNFINER